MKKRIVIIGNGMAGARVAEEILKRNVDGHKIIMFGAEPYGNYNRILLSNVLNQSQNPSEITMNPISWYEENNIKLHVGVKAVHIDRKNKFVLGKKMDKNTPPYGHTDADLTKDELISENYDSLIIATGSRPFVPPIEGFGGTGTFLFRTIDDCSMIADYAAKKKKAIVIGGGLLGLEAARGLITHDLDVTVIEAAPQLMPAQLDIESAQMLKNTMETMGLRVLADTLTSKIAYENGEVSGIVFNDGSVMETDMVVVSAGIRPITEIAQNCGVKVNRGIVCNDQMKTSDPNIFSLGECVEHRGMIYGLVEPIWEQAKVLADVITGCGIDNAYEGSKIGTKLKVMGVELASFGKKDPIDEKDEIIIYREPKRGMYKKLVIRDNKLSGGIFLGNLEMIDTVMRMFMLAVEVPANRIDLLFESSSIPSGDLLNVNDLPDNAQICNCNGVCKKTIVDSIEKDNLTSVAAIGKATKAGKGCGSCKGLISKIIEATIGKVTYDPAEHYYVPGVPLEKSQLMREIKNRDLKSVSSVFKELSGGKEDADSKLGLASLLKIMWPHDYIDERDARFINDRVHANVQKDGTFSVVPRIYGGVISKEELLKIAQAAIKYDVKMVKLTGGQRIDLLGVNKEDLPNIWRDLGIASGHAYTKAFRTCKSCVGTDFCRYGLGDSISLARKIEYRYQGIETPHKVKTAVTGCPRNCAEAYIKDVGVVAVEGENWEIYVGGAAGSVVRKGDLMCTVKNEDEVIKYIDRFLQYYREHGKYLERTYDFVVRLGIDLLKGIIMDDTLGICRKLEKRMEESIQAYKDPWEERDEPFYINQFEGPKFVEVEA